MYPRVRAVHIMRGMWSVWHVAKVCCACAHFTTWQRLLANRHSLPFPCTHSLHWRWCPSASHPLCHCFAFFPYPSLLLLLSFPLSFPSIGHGAHQPLTTTCSSSSSLPNLSLSASLPFPLVRCAAPPVCVESTQRKAAAVGKVRPSVHLKPAVRGPLPNSSFCP